MLNRREQVALLFLTGSLLVGTAAAVVDYYRPETMADFRVVPGAVTPPVVAEAPSAEAPSAAEALSAAGDEAGAAPAPVDVNAASAAELEGLPLVGPVTAARILEYRQEHGPFQSLDDLRHVPGIGARTLARLRPLAVARPPR
ncbi:MAG: ComEA family DNA-binding protein [Gemmatimonadota bacterium]